MKLPHVGILGTPILRWVIIQYMSGIFICIQHDTIKTSIAPQSHVIFYDSICHKSTTHQNYLKVLPECSFGPCSSKPWICAGPALPLFWSTPGLRCPHCGRGSSHSSLDQPSGRLLQLPGRGRDPSSNVSKFPYTSQASSPIPGP